MTLIKKYIALGLLLLITACEKDVKIPDYDRLRGQLILESFDAISKKQHEKANKKLQRLNDII